MKLIKITLSVLLLTGLTAMAQGTVEKSLFNAQLGTFGIWGSYEAGLGSKFALRAEAGFDGAYYESYWGDKGYVMIPSINLEPRWYYNIAKREAKGRNTTKNSANFVTVSFKYYGSFLVIGHVAENVYAPDVMSVIPKWAIRRNIGNSNFNYEAGIGLGYYTFVDDKSRKLFKDHDGAALDLHLRIGYTFK